MSKYKLKTLYPGLHKDYEIGDTITFSDLLNKYTTNELFNIFITERNGK
jgi:hypothetical protein